jgi:hypothetical protein
MNNKKKTADSISRTAAERLHHYGNYGLMRRIFLQRYRPALYAKMQQEGTLEKHLMEVDTAAHRRYKELVMEKEQALEKEASESLHCTDRFDKMRRVWEEADTAVKKELIYV